VLSIKFSFISNAINSLIEEDFNALEAPNFKGGLRRTLLARSQNVLAGKKTSTMVMTLITPHSIYRLSRKLIQRE